MTEDRLKEFLAKIKAPIRPKAGGRSQALAKIVSDRLPRLDDHLAFAFRQFDVGLLDPAEPDMPLTMTNSINIGVMSGGMLQQGTAHSAQSASNSFNAGSAKEALDAFADALKGVSLTQEKLTEIQADLQTIRAQLTTPSIRVSFSRQKGGREAKERRASFSRANTRTKPAFQ